MSLRSTAITLISGPSHIECSPHMWSVHWALCVRTIIVRHSTMESLHVWLYELRLKHSMVTSQSVLCLLFCHKNIIHIKYTHQTIASPMVIARWQSKLQLHEPDTRGKGIDMLVHAAPERRPSVHGSRADLLALHFKTCSCLGLQMRTQVRLA